jgi:hypothetical protein
MPGARRIILAATVALVFPMLVVSGAARAFDLNGAWATNSDQCDKVFEKKANGVALRESSDLYGSGFVIDGKKVIGKTARCTITSKNQDESTINFLASCATEIMLDNIEFSLKIVNDDTISRVFPGIPGMAVTYSRCPASAF